MGGNGSKIGALFVSVALLLLACSSGSDSASAESDESTIPLAARVSTTLEAEAAPPTISITTSSEVPSSETARETTTTSAARSTNSDSSSTVSKKTTTSSKKVTKPAPKPTSPPAPSGSGMSSFEVEIARLTNELRSNPNGSLKRVKPQPACVKDLLQANNKLKSLQPLKVSPSVSVKVSRSWSKNMADTGKFEHSNNLLKPLINLGLDPGSAGENIAYLQGYEDNSIATTMFKGWRESDGHYCNMMNPSFTHIGVGVSSKGNKDYGTQTFYSLR